MIKRFKRYIRTKRLKNQLTMLLSLDSYLKNQGISRQLRRLFWRKMASEENRTSTIMQLLGEVEKL